MRKISLKNVQVGVKLGRSIFTEDGRILLRAGVEMKQSYIDHLEKCNISDIYIEDEISKDIEIRDVVDDTTRIEAKVIVKNVMEDFKSTSRIKFESVSNIVNKITDDLLSNRDILVNLSDIKTTDDYTFAHSVNVCILSIITGIKLGLNQIRLKHLGVGALLHDIGKVNIPESILKKPSMLTDEEYDLIKKHTVFGHEILKTNPDISASSAYIALGHHERYDGSGYPHGVKGENIHIFARIAAIADVYDALTSDRIYRPKMKIHEAVEYMMTVGSRVFDMEILQSFIKCIAIYAIGSGVLLNTGEKGIVVDVNRQFPTRPIVRIIYQADGTKSSKFEEVDLTKKLNIFITDTCDL